MKVLALLLLTSTLPGTSLGFAPARGQVGRGRAGRAGLHMGIPSIDDEGFFDKVLENPKSVLVLFEAAYCGPCRMMKPIVEEIDGENEDLDVFKISTDDYPLLADRYGVDCVPSLLIFSEGDVVQRLVGACNHAVLSAAVAKVLALKGAR